MSPAFNSSKYVDFISLPFSSTQRVTFNCGLSVDKFFSPFRGIAEPLGGVGVLGCLGLLGVGVLGLLSFIF
ncbi:hypothetical protein MUSASHINO07_05600 [Gemella sp. Musashino-2025]